MPQLRVSMDRTVQDYGTGHHHQQQQHHHQTTTTSITNTIITTYHESNVYLHLCFSTLRMSMLNYRHSERGGDDYERVQVYVVMTTRLPNSSCIRYSRSIFLPSIPGSQFLLLHECSH